MNKKGQVVSKELGLIIIVAITLIVGVIFFQLIAQQVGESTNTIAVANHTLDTVVNGTTQYLTDYRAISSVLVYNKTNGTAGTQGPEIGSGNYTVTNNVIHPTTGALTVSILPDATSDVIGIWYISGTAQPLTYIADSGGRTVAGLIAIFFALAVAVVALTPTLRSYVVEKLSK